MIESTTTRVLVIGATGGTGRATVNALLAAGHQVTAFSRSANRLPDQPNLQRVAGDATNLSDIDAVLPGHDAVILTIGIAENPLRVRLLGAKYTPTTVRSDATRIIIDAMNKHQIKRLIVQSSYGVGETRGKLRLTDRLFFALLLKPQIRDTEQQESLVRESGLDWTLVQPVHLSDEPEETAPFLSHEGQVRRFRVARQQVAEFLRASIGGQTYIGQSVAVSG